MNVKSSDKKAFENKGGISPWKETYSAYTMYDLTFWSAIR